MAKIIDLDIELPVIVREQSPNTVTIGTPEILSTSATSIEVSCTFSSNVNYVAGIQIDDEDNTFVRQPQQLTKLFTGLSAGTEYEIRGVGLPEIGNFTLGEAIIARTTESPIPSEYQLVEYLRNTGTQYIDTNYRPVETTVSTIKFYTNVSLPLVFYGYYAGNDSRDYRFFVNYFDIFGGRLTGFNFANRICEVELGNFYVEDLETHARYSGQSQQFLVGDYSIKIFGETANTTPGDFYYAKIAEGNEMVREMYPVYRKSDNKPGMYDIVNDVFYTNAGTGEFTVGPDKEWEE